MNQKNEQITAAIVGATGYAGAILYDLLNHHPNIEKINLYQKNPKQVKPTTGFSLDYLSTIQPYDANQIMTHNQVVFFATPSGVTTNLAKPFLANDFPVIDLSGDFRLKNSAQVKKWYQIDDQSTQLLKKATYGLADLKATDCTKSYVANPGCFATATLLALVPLMHCNDLQINDIVIDAKSGLSGAGKKLSSQTHFVNASQNLKTYKQNHHQHLPEMVNYLQTINAKLTHLQFSTTLIPINRGIMSSIFIKVENQQQFEHIKKQFKQIYQTAPFIKMMDDELPELNPVIGTNECHIGMIYNPITQYLMIESVIDNLVKGAAGQAVQNLNLKFHFKETNGLNLSPIIP